MGWNSWNTFGENIHESLIEETAAALVETGLAEIGYRFVNIDDCWHAEARDDEERLTWDAAKFPGGIPRLAEAVHGMGFGFGIYSCAGTHTCAGRVASFGNEEKDAQTFADWGVDFLKYDYCNKPFGVDGRTLYFRMGQALRSTGRHIIFSACEWGNTEPWLWGRQAGCHMWRTTGDISDSWESIKAIGFSQFGKELYAGPNAWNDPDMLVVGMKGVGNVAAGGCSLDEYKTHFALWCLLAAPLLIGCDVRSIDAESLAILGNRRLVAVNQDKMGAQARLVGSDYHHWDHTLFPTLVKPLADGGLALGMFNLHDERTVQLQAAWEAIGLHDRRPCQVQDLWTGEDLGVHRSFFCAKAAPHAGVVVKLTPLPL